MTRKRGMSRADVEFLRSLIPQISEMGYPKSLRPEFLVGVINPRLLNFAKPFTGSSLKDLQEFIYLHTELSPHEFKAAGRKGTEEMYHEWSIGDMDLLAKNGMLLRLAANVRTEILCKREMLSLQEVSRDFLRQDGTIDIAKRIDHDPFKWWGSSETIRRGRKGELGELAIDEAAECGAQKGMEQEFGELIPLENIQLLSSTPSLPDIHGSSVFAQTISIVISWSCRTIVDSVRDWQAPKAIRHPTNDNYITIQDGNVLVNHLWDTPRART